MWYCSLLSLATAKLRNRPNALPIPVGLAPPRLRRPSALGELCVWHWEAHDFHSFIHALMVSTIKDTESSASL